MAESGDSTHDSELDQVPLKITKGLNAGKWLSILSLLKNGSHSEQVMALTELSNLLSYSNEEYLLGFPSLAYIRVLFHTLENPRVKYSKVQAQGSENGSDSQELGMRVQLPYYQLLSSIYKDDRLFMDGLYTNNLVPQPEAPAAEDPKPPEDNSQMDLDEAEFDADPELLTHKMILAATCLNTILDIVPYTSRYFATNMNLNTLCNKLSDLEYIDLAERILLIFEKLSHEIPLSLLKKSVPYHMLQYIDFFPMNVQISTLSCVLNVVRLVDSNEYFSQHVIPILTPLASFLQTDSKKMLDAALSIWKELLTIVSRVGDDVLISDFVRKLSENNFLEKILRLILSPNIGRSALLEHLSILSSLVQMSTEMVEQLFKFDQLANIKQLCYNEKDSLQYIFVHLVNNILSNQISEEYVLDDLASSDKDLVTSDEEMGEYDLHHTVETIDNRDLFFCENEEYFAAVFDLLPLTELCDTFYFLTSDRHKSAVIGLFYNLIRIANKIDRFRQALLATLSVSKTTEFVSTCFLQVDLKAGNTFDSLMGILQVLISIFGNDVILTFQRYGINHFLQQFSREHPDLYDRDRDLIDFILNDAGDHMPTSQADTLEHDADLLFEIRNNVDVWTPYELVKNVPLDRINYFRDEKTLHKFIATLVNQSHTTKQLQILWKAFMKILQYTNICAVSSRGGSEAKLSEDLKHQDANPTSGVNNEVLAHPTYQAATTCLTATQGSASEDPTSTHTDAGTSNENGHSTTTTSENVHILGNVEKRTKFGLESVLKKYVNTHSSHPFNVLHTELKLRLRPLHHEETATANVPVIAHYGQTNTGEAKTVAPDPNSDQNAVTESSPNRAPEFKLDRSKLEAKEDDRLLPICVYVPCLVRVSKIESYLKRYIEKKKGFRVSEVFVYVNGVCLGPNAQLYEALCRFSGLPPKKRRQLTNMAHVIKYTYTVNRKEPLNTSANNSFISTRLDSHSSNNPFASLGDRFSALTRLDQLTRSLRVELTRGLRHRLRSSLVQDSSDAPEEDTVSKSPARDFNAASSPDLSQSTTGAGPLAQLADSTDPNTLNPTEPTNQSSLVTHPHTTASTLRNNEVEDYYGLKFYTLYKSGKYNYKSLRKDFVKFVKGCSHESKEDKSALGTSEARPVRDDDGSTLPNTTRSEPGPYAEPLGPTQTADEGTNYLDTSKLIEIYKTSNDLEDAYMSTAGDYLAKMCNQTAQESKPSEFGSVEDLRPYNSDNAETEPEFGSNMGSLERKLDMDPGLTDHVEKLDNPILYARMPSAVSSDEHDTRLDHLTSLVKFDQERISFILGESNRFDDFLLESAFPRLPKLLSRDKKLLLRTMSTFANLAQSMSDHSPDMSLDPTSTDLESPLKSGLGEEQDATGLVTSSSLSLKVLSACSELGTSICFGCEYWVTFVLLCPNIFSLWARTVLFRLNTVGLNRNLCDFYYRVKNVSNDIVNDAFDEYLFDYLSSDNFRLLDEEVKLHKVTLRLDRENLLEDAMSNFEKLQNNPKLEIEYKNEPGTGSGPTLEFFTLIAEQLATHVNPELLTYNEGYYFPAPHIIQLGDNFLDNLLNASSSGTPSAEDLGDKVATDLFNLFSFLGKVFAYALLDDKIFDLSLHPLFWSMVKYPNRPLEFTLDTLRQVDSKLADSLQKIREHPDPSHLSLTHEFQGYELFKGGSKVPVTSENVDNYVRMLVEFKLFHGVKLQVWAFRYGFSTALPLYSLWFFTDLELSEMVFGSMRSQHEFWRMDHLKNYIVPDHGYHAESSVYKDLLAVLHGLSESERRLFLKFATGAPILPRQGFKSLVPLMRVVKKGNVDELPSVMTCTNYLKMPEYRDASEMRAKLLKAIHEGQNSFNLS